MAASFYESLEEKSSRLFFGWVMGADEVLRRENGVLYWANGANRTNNKAY